MPDASAAGGSLAERVADTTWYHTLELPGGIVTPGEYDLRPVLARVPLPASLEGKRCLDVGTHDGFWAFEMERRGASEVVALDLDDPADIDWPLPAPELTGEVRAAYDLHRRAFDVARDALGSRVDRRSLSVYELSPGLVGRFDFATVGTLLLHLRDPIGALASIRRVLDGRLLVNEAISASLTLLRRRTPAAKLLLHENAPFWWLPNAAALQAYVVQAGYDVARSGRPYLLSAGAGAVRVPVHRARGNGIARQLLMRRGMPHKWILAEPRHSA